MTDVADRNPAPPALQRARELAGNRRWRELADLADLADEATAESVRNHPELAYLLADALRRIGEIDRSVALATRAHEGTIRQSDSPLRLRCVNLLGMLEFDRGRMEDAADAFEQLLDRATCAGDDEFVARASNNLGVIASIRGERELALTTYQRAIAAYQRLGYARGLAQTHYNVAIVYRDLGFLSETEGNLALAYRYAAEGPHDDVIGLIETERALLLAAAGDGALAEKLAERAIQVMRRQNDPLGEANAERALAASARSLGRPALALRRLESALSKVELHPDLLLRAEIQRDRGTLLLEAGDDDGAAAALQDSVECFEALGATLEAAATSRLLSRTG